MRYLKWIVFFVGLSFINHVKEDLYYAYKSSSWTPVQGMILESALATPSPEKDRPQTYVPEITYRYEVSGKKIRNNRVSFEREFRDKSQAASIVEKYPRGKPVTVFYNPSSPSQAVLEPGIKISALITSCTGALMALFSFLLFSIRRLLKKFLAGFYMIQAGGALILDQGGKILEGASDLTSFSFLFFNSSGAALVYSGYRLCKPLVLDLWNNLRKWRKI